MYFEDNAELPERLSMGYMKHHLWTMWTCRHGTTTASGTATQQRSAGSQPPSAASVLGNTNGMSARRAPHPSVQIVGSFTLPEISIVRREPRP